MDLFWMYLYPSFTFEVCPSSGPVSLKKKRVNVILLCYNLLSYNKLVDDMNFKQILHTELIRVVLFFY